MTESLRLTVHGAPRTKKTSNRLVRAGGRHRVLPSKAWESWVKSARIQRVDAPLTRYRGPFVTHWIFGTLPDRPYNCAALFYRDADRGDAVGYYQGLADLLERVGVLSNDKFITSWDGSRLLVDRENPRVEITLTPLEG